MTVAGIVGAPLGAPTPAHPVGAEPSRATSAPMSAGVGLPIPERELSATERWDPIDDPCDPDEPDEADLGPRHRAAI